MAPSSWNDWYTLEDATTATDGINLILTPYQYEMATNFYRQTKKAIKKVKKCLKKIKKLNKSVMLNFLPKGMPKYSGIFPEPVYIYMRCFKPPNFMSLSQKFKIKRKNFLQKLRSL